MASNNKLLADGHAKRADLVKIRLDQIHVEPGFNVPETPEEFDERVNGILAHLKQGGYLPPIEVRDRAEGGVYVVEGHARREAHIRAVAEGVPVHDPKDGQVYLLTVRFNGNDADRVLRSVTSATGRTLSMSQLANRYKMLIAFGWSAAQIAEKVSKSREHVHNVLGLGNANSDVQQMVAQGTVSASVAGKAARKYGEKAGAVLTEQLEKVKAEGGAKVTTSSLEGKKVKVSVLDDERACLNYLIEQRALVQHGGKMSTVDCSSERGFWLYYPDDDATQKGVYPTARAAIHAAIQADKEDANV